MFTIFNFFLAAIDFQLAGVSTDAGTKESSHEGVHASKSPSSREPSADIETTTPRDTSVLDIALVSGGARTVKHDVVYGLLAECLQDVSSAVFVKPYLVFCCWVFNVSLFLY
jgi:hypothetical protein